MKMCVFLNIYASLAVWTPHTDLYEYRLMSDYEVTLVNDCMQEFYVRFYGPAESTSPPIPLGSRRPTVLTYPLYHLR